MTEQKNDKGKSSISKASSYEEIGEYWDTHDLTDHWDETRFVEFKVNLQNRVHYYPVTPDLSTKIHQIAEGKGVSAETLLNEWIEEKVNAAK